MAELYSIRAAKPEAQRGLTRLCVRATAQAGYDEAFIDWVMPTLTITVPLITGGYVRVAEDGAGEAIGVVTVTPTAVLGIALLDGRNRVTLGVKHDEIYEYAPGPRRTVRCHSARRGGLNRRRQPIQEPRCSC